MTSVCVTAAGAHPVPGYHEVDGFGPISCSGSFDVHSKKLTGLKLNDAEAEWLTWALGITKSFVTHDPVFVERPAA